MKTSSKSVYLLIIIITFIFYSQTQAFTKDEVYRNITKKQQSISFAFKADIISKMNIQGQTVKDSGSLTFSPPDCFKITMYKAKTEISILGDTTYTVMPNGNVTRSINSNNMPGMSSVGQSYGAPQVGDMLKKSDFTIIEEKPGKHVVIEFNMPMPTGVQKVQATFDTNEWLIRNMKIPGGPTGTIETGYTYEKFKGRNMLRRINMVMGAMGFMIMDYKNYRSIKKLSRKSFKKF